MNHRTSKPNPPPRPEAAPVRTSIGFAVAAALASGSALADAQLGAELAQRLASALPTEELSVVVTWAEAGPVSPAELSAMAALGIERGVTFRSLPIAGALATPAEVQALAARDGIASIHLNRPLRYFNAESRQISGVERLQANPQAMGRPIPYSGFGVTVVINDSGIDATHMDLNFGDHVVENVQGLTNLHAVDGMLPVTYLEGQPNTDTNSGHGTHCAGTFGGSGERSGGLYQGVAPGADIVGYGSGGAIAILDAVGGFDYAITNQFSFDSPIRVISNSWGSAGSFDPLDPVNVASYEAYKRGIVTVFAAGNDGPGEDTHNPYAQAPWVISVGAGRKDGSLEPFSSRGKRGESGTFTMPDGQSWTYVNEPTVVATGVNVVSTRAATNLVANGGDADLDVIAPAHLPFYTMISGTSMATPHVAGIAALMLEANPGLDPMEVKDILQRTAANMTGKLAWEAGAGHVNAWNAVAEAVGLRSDFGATVNPLRSFHSNAKLVAGDSFPFSVDFLPAGTAEEQSFEVGPETAWVSARAVVEANTVALVLTDPDGVRYGSAIALPLLGSTIVTSAPAKPGTWTVTARGIGSVSGVAVDPLGATNGYALPGTVAGTVTFLDSGGYDGLDDIDNHPVRGAIEHAVSFRLIDGYSDRKFRPDSVLRRQELAEYLTMGASVRQSLPLSGTPSFPDLSTGSRWYPFAEAAVANGAALRDLGQSQDGLIRLQSGAFKPNGSVTRLDLAYALVQALALQEQAEAFSGTLTVDYNGERIAIEDAGQIPASLHGHVQLALDSNLVGARFTMTQGPFDLQPTVHAWFDPGAGVTRAGYAVVAGRFASQFAGPAE